MMIDTSSYIGRVERIKHIEGSPWQCFTVGSDIVEPRFDPWGLHHDTGGLIQQAMCYKSAVSTIMVTMLHGPFKIHVPQLYSLKSSQRKQECRLLFRYVTFFGGATWCPVRNS